MLSEKYGRTYHFPFSPGTTSDDRINHTYWEDIQRIDTLVYTEKLDGENNCLNSAGGCRTFSGTTSTTDSYTCSAAGSFWYKRPFYRRRLYA